MTKLSAMFGIKPEALPAWLSLCAALDRLADAGKQPLCAQRPDQWSADAPAPSRQDAAEACSYCPLLHPCAAYADVASEHGVWGGVDRSRLKREAA